MKNYKLFLKKLFKKHFSPEEFKEVSLRLKRIIKKAFNIYFSPQIEKNFQKYYGSNYLDDLTQEFILKLISNKNILEKKKFIHENYILSSARNLICYKLYIIKKSSEREINFADLLPEDAPEDEENYIVEERIAQYVVDYLEDLKLQHIFSIIKENLNRKDLETLCWYIYKDIYQEKFPIPVKVNTLYKRWERLKIKLKKILGEDLFFGKIPAEKLFERIKSEICEKLNYNKKKEVRKL